MDRVTGHKRSKMMSGIKAKGTKPEMLVRKLLFAQGFRYRLHEKELPGCPDIVMRKHNLCIFVQGCYWHRHKSCRLAAIPKTRTKFWIVKFEKNIHRDIKNQALLLSLGWRILLVWECATRALPSELMSKLLNECVRLEVPIQEITCTLK